MSEVKKKFSLGELVQMGLEKDMSGDPIPGIVIHLDPQTLPQGVPSKPPIFLSILDSGGVTLQELLQKVYDEGFGEGQRALTKNFKELLRIKS